jgi:hypothetical protein
LATKWFLPEIGKVASLTVHLRQHIVHPIPYIITICITGVGFFLGRCVFRRFSQRFLSVFFARPNLASWRLWNGGPNGEPMRGLLEYRRKSKTPFFHREIKTPNRVLKPKNITCYFPTPALQIVIHTSTYKRTFAHSSTLHPESPKP